jgi:hypothetical protein
MIKDKEFIYDGENEPEEEILEGDDEEIIDEDDAEEPKSWIDDLIGN